MAIVPRLQSPLIIAVDPATTAITSLWPKANRTPQPVFSGGTLLYQSDGTNYDQNVTSAQAADPEMTVARFGGNHIRT